MNPADDALNGPHDAPPKEVFYLGWVADHATSIDEVVIALEEAVKYLLGKEAEGYVLDATVVHGRVGIRPGP